MNKTLFKQDIYHGTTVDLLVPLRGGVKGELIYLGYTVFVGAM